MTKLLLSVFSVLVLAQGAEASVLFGNRDMAATLSSQRLAQDYNLPCLRNVGNRHGDKLIPENIGLKIQNGEQVFTVDMPRGSPRR
jgi:hypothetical protein